MTDALPYAINEHLHHKGVRFSILRAGVAEDAGFRWTIFPTSAGPEGAASGVAMGRSAFAKAYREACAAVDQWVLKRDGESGEAVGDHGGRD